MVSAPMSGGETGMATSTDNCSKSESRAMMRFLHVSVNFSQKVQRDLSSVYGEVILSKGQVNILYW